MRTMLKRILACTLCLVMCVLAPAAFAEEIEAGYQLKEKMAEADRAYCARSQGDSLHQEGGFSIWRTGSWVEYDLEIPVAGDYHVGIKMGGSPGDIIQHSVSIDGVVVIEQLTKDDGVTVTGGFGSNSDGDKPLEELVIGTVTFETAGAHTIHIESIGGNAFYSDYMFITYLGAPVEVVSVTAGEADMISGDSVSAGCDVITAEFSKDISDELNGSLDGKVSLKDDNGQSLALYGEVNGNTLTIQLAEALSEGKNYTLTFRNVVDFLNSSSVKGDSYTFDAIAGDGAASVSEAYAEVDGELVNINAKMLSSQDIGIKGRAYNIFICYADEEKGDTPDITGETEADGVIAALYEMPEGSADGEYKIYISGEYVAEDEVISAVYVTQATKDIIEAALAECESPEEVEAVLSDAQNALYIGINPQTELGTLRKTEVYNHFIGKDIKFDDIKTEFRKYIAVENFRQSTTVLRLRQQINKEENWINLGLVKAKYDLIPSEDINAVINAIKSLTETDADEYIRQIDLIVNNKLSEIYNKTALTPAFEDIKAYVNQGVEIPIAFEEEVSDMILIAFTLTVSDAEMLDVAEVTLDVDGEVSYETEGNVLNVLIGFDNPTNENDLGAVSITVPETVGTYTAELKGTAYFAPSAIDYILYADINEASMQITASKKSSGTSSSASRKPSGGSGGGGSASVTPVTPVVPAEPPKEAFSFSDVSEDHWAYESVDYLLKNGIIEETADGKYNPDEKMAREEIVKMMVLALGLTDENAVSNLSDVTKSSPYYKYIASAEKYGIVLGNDLGEFMIGAPVTREDICVILHRAVEKVYSFKGSDNVFADDNVISDYAKEAVYDMKGAGIIEGVGENEFMPKGDVTRAQAAKMIYEIVKAVGR